MECNPEEILLYVDGELSPDDAARVRAHAAACASCREILQTEQELGSALGSLQGLEPPPGFASATVIRARCDVTHALRSPHERRRAFAISASLAFTSLLLLWPTGVAGSVLQMVAPARCMARFVGSWLQSWALSVYIVSRTLSRNLLSEASLPVGAAVVVLALLLALLVWLVRGYRRHAAVGERGEVR
jgi:anti-sigma factor RsiW